MRSILIGALGLLAAAPLAAQLRDWSPRDRVVIGDFTRITTVAASNQRVYATTTSQLLIWNPQFRQWEGPYLPQEPGLLAHVFTALADPVDNTLWLGRLEGWVHFDPGIQLWQSGVVSSTVQGIAFDLASPYQGLFLRTADGWMTVARGGGIAVPSAPPKRPSYPTTVQQAIQANPVLQANSAAILMDQRMQMARYTSAARGYTGLGWYLGTLGVGLLYLPDGAAVPDRLTFGLPGKVAGAVYEAPDGIWVATDGTAADNPGLTLAARDLSNFQWLQGPPATGLPFAQVREMIRRDHDLWAATNAGLARIEPGSGDVKLYDEGRGLPDSRVFSVTQRKGRIAAGTAHGIVVLDDSNKAVPFATAFVDPAFALLWSPGLDSLWVGTPHGVYVGVPGKDQLHLPAGSAQPSLRHPVIGLAWDADTLVALTEDQLVWRAPGDSVWQLGPPLSGVLGPLKRMALGPRGFWIAGQQAVAFTRLDSPPIQPLLGGADYPGEAEDVAVDKDYVWIATDQGLVRFRRDAVEP